MSRSKKPRRPTVREMVLAALAAGETVIAYEFAKTCGTTGSMVSRVLREFGDLLQRRDISTGPGHHCVEWKAKRPESIEAEIGRISASEGLPRLRFDELLEAWGIAREPAQLKLPSFCHRMADNDDESELEAA